ncbi:CoA ester lyase [Sphingomonas aracearum]|uniref:CoA ester lyase n=1 Tax=Sphingomonas aracearum TaxID=2283317 RepID=A0A369VYK9_9SPHN|nr:CoA ester lyase [Sphingomonas aracearum]
MKPHRSALFLPASNRRAIEKAQGLPCDVVILDLEDAVAPEAKGEARAQAVDAVRGGGFGARQVVVRINALTTPEGAADARALGEARPDAVLLPKVSRPADITHAQALLRDLPIWAMIETPAAVLALPAIAAVAGLECLVAGTNDLAKDLRCTPGEDRMPLLPHLAAIVVAARAHGLTALDGVSNVLAETEALVAECDQGARLGFDGKTLIHPAQIAAANRAFAPTEAQIAEARAIVAAFAAPEAAGKGAIRVDGRMVERLHLVASERVLALAAASA